MVSTFLHIEPRPHHGLCLGKLPSPMSGRGQRRPLTNNLRKYRKAIVKFLGEVATRVL